MSVFPSSTTEKRVEEAKLALANFNKLAPSLSGFASALIGNEVNVIAGAGTYSDGKTITIRPSMSLAKSFDHDRKNCDKRDVITRKILCPECSNREHIISVFFHEIGHIVFDSFQKYNLTEITDATIRIMPDKSTIAKAKNNLLQLDGYRADPMAAAKVLNKFAPMLLNLAEDARVDSSMARVRPGTADMLESEYVDVAFNGMMLEDGTVITYAGLDLNAQMTLHMYAKAKGYAQAPGIKDYVLESAATSAISGLIEGIKLNKSPFDSFVSAVSLLVACQELGFFIYDDKHTYLPEPELKPEPEPEPEPDGEGFENKPGDDNEDGDDSDGEASGQNSGQGSGTSDASGDDEGGEENADSQDADDAPGDAESGDDKGPDGGDKESSDDDSPVDGGTGEGDKSSSDGGESGTDDTEFDKDDTADNSTTEGAGNSDSVDKESATDAGVPSGASDDSEEDESGEADDAPMGTTGSKGADDTVEETSDQPSTPRPSSKSFGKDAQKLDKILKVLSGHSETGSGKEEAAIMDIIMEELSHFDEVSNVISGISFITEANFYGTYRGLMLSSAQRKIPESIISPSLLHMRRALSENAMANRMHNKRSGRVNPRVLGRRAWSDDDRLFSKKSIPGKRDYAVLIGIDISGSTLQQGPDMRTIHLELLAASAQAELCHRMGIKFSVYAHTGGRDRVEIYKIKTWDQLWNDAARNRLFAATPLNANLDGHTLEFYRKEMDKVRATDKIIMYYSDGAMPRENYVEELKILKREIDTCKKRGYVLMGVGARTNSPSSHGLDTVRIDSIGDLQKVVKHLGKQIEEH